MKVVSLIIGLSGTSVFAEPIAVPSGQHIEFKQLIWSQESEIPNATFRFIAPEISRDKTGIDYDTAVGDILFLCENFALPRVLKEKSDGEIDLVISLSQLDLEFGEVNPEVTQFFEAFVVRDSVCNWADL